MALVTDIVKRAKIEPIVFYNRYKNLDEFYDTFVKRYDYWLSDTLHTSKTDPMTEKGYGDILDKLLKELMSDSIMTELLRWEICEGTDITKRTARLREIDSNILTNKYARLAENSDLDIVALTALMIGGIYYMVLHKDRSPLCGIDINGNEGMERLLKALHQQANLIFKHREEKKRREKLAECLAKEGLNEDAIARCMETAFGE